MLPTSKTGWLGFDLGGATVKMAQVVRAQGEYRLRTAAIVPRPNRWNADELTAEQPLSSGDELQTAASLAAVGRGGAAAVVLPMMLCDVAYVAAPEGHRRNTGELTALVEAELHQSLDGHLLVDWPTPWDETKRNIIAAPAAWSDQVSRDLADGRWNCRTIDALPWALARAVGLVEPSAERPVLALDWGYNRATLCLIHQGVPALVRGLKNCSFQCAVAAVQALLRLPESDAELLLARQEALGPESHAASGVVADALAPTLDRLESEIRRTLAYWQGQARGIKPEAMYLFGGGASLRELGPRLTSTFGIEARTWTLPAEDSAASLPPAYLLGPAAAASMLAWEDQ